MSDYYERLQEATAHFSLQDRITLGQLFQLEGVTEVMEEEAENEKSRTASPIGN